MEDTGFVENGFIIDLGNAENAAEIIYELSSILDMPEAKNKKICLKLGAIDLSQSQLLSIKSLINSMSSDIAFVDTSSHQTELSALSLGIIISELSNEIVVPEIEPDSYEALEGEIHEKAVETVQEFNQEPDQGLSFDILGNNDDSDDYDDDDDDEDDDEDGGINLVPPKNISAKEVEATQEEIIPEEATAEDKQEQTTKEKPNLQTSNLSKLPTLYLQQTLRSGQTISYDGNIVVIGDAHAGSEIIAKGDITIWGVLAGIAHAGARGNDFAKIRALKINAIQLRISGFYSRRPDTLNIPFIQRTNEFTPEEARVENSEIAVYKTYEV